MLACWRKEVTGTVASGWQPYPLTRNVSHWYVCDMPTPSSNVRVQKQTGSYVFLPSSSQFDPTVWTGRALQAGCEQMEGDGLAHLYPALAWSVCAPGHHGYPRAPDLILRKALRGRLGHQITGTTARPFLHFLHPTRRPRQVSSRLVS